MIMLGKSGVVDVRINRRSGGPSTHFFGGEGKRTSFFFFPFPREFVKEEREEDFIAVYNEIPWPVLRNDRPVQSRFVIKKLKNYFWICS